MTARKRTPKLIDALPPETVVARIRSVPHGPAPEASPRRGWLAVAVLWTVVGMTALAWALAPRLVVTFLLVAAFGLLAVVLSLLAYLLVQPES